MLRMLKIFDYLCRKNNIEYWIDFGTLLGAVRHKGFIPWDGDLDVGMTRKCYDKFLETCILQLPQDIFFQNSKTDPYYSSKKNITEAKLRDKYSNYDEWQEKNPTLKWHNGIQVDIFVYDKWLSKTKSISNIQRRIMFRSLLSNRFLKIFYKHHKVNHYATLYGNIIKEDDIFPLNTLEFEGFPVMIPNNYCKYLRGLYGDYMKLPPENERHTHEGKIEPLRPCNHKEILNWDKDKII